MGQNSCQPKGLQPKPALTLSAGLTIFAICPASSFALSPIFARNAHALHYVRHSKLPLTSMESLMMLLVEVMLFWSSTVVPSPWTTRLSAASGARALALNYRLAPEHPFPAAVVDAGKGYRWLLGQGVDAASLVIAGDSAGGRLTVQSAPGQGTTVTATFACVADRPPAAGQSEPGRTASSAARTSS